MHGFYSITIHVLAARIQVARLVEHRMRVAYIVPRHREWIYSGYSSEPILAEAAARYWAKIRARNMSSIPSLLNRSGALLASGRGQRGELVGKMLLTLAFDAAVEHLLAKNKPLIHYTTAVPLCLFLKELFGDAHYAHIMDSLPNVGTMTMGEAFKGAFVRFTHFVRLGEEASPSASFSYISALRSMAFQCDANEETMNIVIPVVLEDSPSEEAIMTGLLNSVTSREKRSATTVADIDAEDISFFPDNQTTYKDTDHGRPYIAILLDLESLHTHTAPPPRSQYPIDKGTPTLRNPPYCIRVSGCSPDVYKVVTTENEKDFATLLDLPARTVFSEHARQSPESIEAIRRMMPLIMPGPECFDWIGGPLAEWVQGSGGGVGLIAGNWEPDSSSEDEDEDEVESDETDDAGQASE